MGDLSLSTIANVAEIIGAGSIITGLIFGWFQIRHFRAQQRDAVAINLMQTFYSDDLAEAQATIHAFAQAGVSRLVWTCRYENADHCRAELDKLQPLLAGC